MTRWQRPPGPLNVWKVVDGYEKLADGTTKPVKFSIQDIPNEPKRIEEVYDLLSTHFLAGEPCSKSTNLKDDPDGVNDFMTVWKYGMTHEISVGCYKLNSDGKIGQLVGVNLMYIMTEESIKDFQKIEFCFCKIEDVTFSALCINSLDKELKTASLMNFTITTCLEQTIKSKAFKHIWDILAVLSKDINVFEIYQVDRYISSFSLSVDPAFQGQKLGYHMLDARREIAKKYGIYATSTAFTHSASQRAAELAGFQVRNTVDYAECVDEQGNLHFPNIHPDSVKLMMRRLP